MIRSNMNFMNLGKGEIKVIMVTSSNPHAGKTFVSINLAMTFATTGKKVVIMDLDLRRRTFSKQMGHGGDTNGVSSYLSGSTELQAIIRKSKLSEKLDIIYAGIQPPNPSEMLLSQRMEELIAELKLHYDYIIIDSTPAMAVSDAIITDRLADLSIYVSTGRPARPSSVCRISNGCTAKRNSITWPSSSTEPARQNVTGTVMATAMVTGTASTKRKPRQRRVSGANYANGHVINFKRNNRYGR